MTRFYRGDAAHSTEKYCFAEKVISSILGRMKNSRFTALVVGIFAKISLVTTLSVASAAPTPLPFAPESTKVTYDAVGRPSMLKIHGESKELTSALLRDGNTVSGKITFKPATLDSGISLRDSHARDKYLEVGKFPEAVFEISALEVPASLATAADGTEVEWKVPGKLTLHGVTAPIEALTTMKKSGAQVEVRSTFQVKLPDYQVSIPSFAGIKVAEDVTLTIQFKTEWK